MLATSAGTHMVDHGGVYTDVDRAHDEGPH